MNKTTTQNSPVRRGHALPGHYRLQREGHADTVSLKAVIEAREREAAAERRTLTQSFMGDPAPGYSALDKTAPTPRPVSLAHISVVPEVEDRRRIGTKRRGNGQSVTTARDQARKVSSSKPQVNKPRTSNGKGK
jgi:hypothetical protein